MTSTTVYVALFSTISQRLYNKQLERSVIMLRIRESGSPTRVAIFNPRRVFDIGHWSVHVRSNTWVEGELTGRTSAKIVTGNVCSQQRRYTHRDAVALHNKHWPQGQFLPPTPKTVLLGFRRSSISAVLHRFTLVLRILPLFKVMKLSSLSAAWAV
jgi:hypothetical protein